MYGMGMYLPGEGHNHFGPGTSMVQRINWTTGQEMQMAEGFDPVGGLNGIGCCASCESGGKCESGLGLFDTMDVSTWGWGEWGIVIFGGYMVLSTLMTTTRGVKRVGRGIKYVGGAPGRSRKARAKKLRDEARRLES